MPSRGAFPLHVEARALRAGMTAYLGGRYRELTAAGVAFPGTPPRPGTRIVVVTVCTRGYVLEHDAEVRVRPTDRGVAM